MRNLLLTAVALLAFNVTFAADFIKELENSINRKECKVTYTLHMGDGKEQIFTGHDFSSGGIIEKGGIPIYFENAQGFGR